MLAGGLDDMTKLAYLHEPGVLHNLGCRYELNEIYVSGLWKLFFNDLVSIGSSLWSEISNSLLENCLDDLVYFPSNIMHDPRRS